MNIIEQAERNTELILPKLQAFKRNAGAAWIHDVDQQIAILRNFRDLMRKPRRLDPELIAQDLLHAVEKAEKFLVEVSMTVLTGD